MFRHETISTVRILRPSTAKSCPASVMRPYSHSCASDKFYDSAPRSEMRSESNVAHDFDHPGRGGPDNSFNNGSPQNPVLWRPYNGRWSSKTTHAEPSGTQAQGTASPDRARRNGPRWNQRPKNRRSHQGPASSIVPPHRAAPWQSHHELNAASPAGPTGNLNNGNSPSGFAPAPGVTNAASTALSPPPGLVPHQQPFFTQNMSGQWPSLQENVPPQPQQQFTPQANTFPLPFQFPTWDDFHRFASQLPPMPPPPLMNMAMQNPLLAMPWFSPPALRTNFPAERVSSQQQPPVPSNSEPRRSKPVETPAPIPSPTAEYLQQSSLPPTRNSSSRPLLVILDLNGTLVHRKNRLNPPSFTERAGFRQFRETLLRKYSVMVWSSSQPFTVRGLCHKLFPGPARKKLIAEWGRDKFNLTQSQYRSKTQVYKTLSTVWCDQRIQSSYPKGRGRNGQQPTEGAEDPHWDQTNTILIDDSKLKAISEPYNILEVPEFTGQPGPDDHRVLSKVLQLLEELARYDDVSQVLRRWCLTLEESGNASILDIVDTIAPRQPQDQQTHNGALTPPRDAIAEARIERRKARKQEKKAARVAPAAPAAVAQARTLSPVAPSSTEHHSYTESGASQPSSGTVHRIRATNSPAEAQGGRPGEESSQPGRCSTRSLSPVTPNGIRY
ncbi:NIF domain protein [Aspergillus saccharolyticus JOP 1030-1]|uniref:HAD-like protein n=1 Tax=Aspergillus saccharolyticus JOP 1030-1 TaxID=1450539 RepID=A0A318ZL55_9EURO|nr:HAD-like protein [Aspergillus saccharolyticus JOP 1030-1]PYH48236.1 HAD-like protein [Aspergillus saccharolyticus JOP 1030-1]